jgi:hypothetical protein
MIQVYKSESLNLKGFEKFDFYIEKYHIKNELYNKIEDILFAKRSKNLKKQSLETKISVTNSILLKILDNLNEEDTTSLASTEIHKIDTSQMNTDLYEYCFNSKDLKYKLDQKKEEDIFIKAKLSYEREEQTLKEKLIASTTTSKLNLEIAEASIESNKQSTKVKNLKKIVDTKEAEYDEKIQKNKKDKFKKILESRKRLLDSTREFEENISQNLDNKKKMFRRFKNKNLQNYFENYVLIPPKKSTVDKKKLTPIESESCVFNEDEIHKLKKRKIDLVAKAIHYLEAYDLIMKDDLNTYKLNLQHSVHHPLSGAYVVGKLLPVLISDIKLNYKNSVEKFLEHIDSLIEYSLQDPKQFGKDAYNEWTVLKAYHSYKAVRIETVSSKVYKNVSIDEIYFTEDLKKALYFTCKTKQHDLEFSKIELISLEKDEKKESSNSNSNEFGQASKFMSHLENYTVPDRKPHETLLEVDIHISDFFEIKPLKNQVMYKTKSEIDSVLKMYGIEKSSKDKKNKIYIVASDTTDEIIHVAKRCLPYVDILEPPLIKEEFENIIKSKCKDIKKKGG